MELSELTLKVRELAVATGAFIREERKKFSRERIEKKHAHDYVSYVDKESERRIVACLRELLYVRPVSVPAREKAKDSYSLVSEIVKYILKFSFS